MEALPFVNILLFKLILFIYILKSNKIQKIAKTLEGYPKSP